MSNIYIQEPPTAGKVLISTTAGDLDIELWSKEAPKACRNFVQLCLESYYDGTIFHRVVPGFIIQGGDPSGTGKGGESIYGKPFKDEFHSRLRFVRRGLVAMANAGPNDNASQFFITLAASKDLQNKHTIFGKIAGDTIYNLPRFEEGIFDKDDRPEHPYKITKTEVLNNPFTDIIPRLKIENEIPKEEKESKRGTKNFKLLSFGDEAEEDEEQFVKVNQSMTKANSAHDIAKDPTLSSHVGDKSEDQDALERIKKKFNKLPSSEAAEPGGESDSIPQAQNKSENKDDQDKRSRSEIKAEIRKLKRELHGKSHSKETPSETPLPEDIPLAKKPKLTSEYDLFMEEKHSYKSDVENLPKKGSNREKQTMLLLSRFRNKIKKSDFDDDDEQEKDNKIKNFKNEDESWLHHKILFDDNAPVLAKDASTKDDSWYDINDPRNPHARRRREKESKKS